MPEQTKTETEAIAELAVEPVILEDTGERMLIGVPPYWNVESRFSEPFEEAPHRLKGTILVNTAGSFKSALAIRRADSLNLPVIYADEVAHTLVAVLNDDSGNATGWRDYRVELQLRRTPEWDHWRSKDGVMFSQENFAEHIEDGLAELVTPPSAEVLDLAQTFHVTTAARFKSGRRLASGETQFVYEEELDAKAGASGTIVIPTELKLSVAPFKGSDPQDVTALFRFRVNREAGLSLGYKLRRPHEVEDTAFEAIVALVGAAFSDVEVITGPAPTPRS